MKPYYEDEAVTIYHGDCREVLPEDSEVGAGFSIEALADVLITDPPFGIAYVSNHEGALERSISGDMDVALRDEILDMWQDCPALVFGSWKVPRPLRTRQVLIWDTLGALGMGDLALPWKPAHQEIYVIGSGFVGVRGSDVLRYPPVQSSAWRGRCHPTEKPVALLRDLIDKCPADWYILDPFMGSGTTLRAAKDLGRKAIGIEIEERYAEIAARRMSQEVLPLGYDEKGNRSKGSGVAKVASNQSPLRDPSLPDLFEGLPPARAAEEVP